MLFVAKYFAKQIYKDVWVHRFIVHRSELPIERLQKKYCLPYCLEIYFYD